LLALSNTCVVCVSKVSNSVEGIGNLVIVIPIPGGRIREVSRHDHRDEAQVVDGIEEAQPLDRLRAARLEIRHQRGDEKVEKATLRDMRPAEPLRHGARPHQLGMVDIRRHLRIHRHPQRR